MDLGTWLTIWLPIAGMLALLVWSVRLWRRAQAEIAAADHLRGEYRDKSGSP